ncbi:MAG TPA: GIY-YIG nuclease family protein [Ktedonobacteraceae bacterium]
MDILSTSMNKPQMDEPSKAPAVHVAQYLREEFSLQRNMMINSEKKQMDHMTVQQRHHVYMVKCVDGSLYTGYAKNVEQRVATHNAGKGGRYTRSHLPVTLLATWSFNSKGEALRAEYAIKRLPREQKWRLIAMPSLLKDLGSESSTPSHLDDGEACGNVGCEEDEQRFHQ